MEMSILDKLGDEEEWNSFLQYKIQKQNISRSEEDSIRLFVESKRYVDYKLWINRQEFPTELPRKKQINKEGSTKKRTVYVFPPDDSIVLKFLAFQLYAYEDIWSSNCYSFRREYGIRDAMSHFRFRDSYGKKYCFKADVSNYFNSMNVELLLDKMSFLKQRDVRLYELFEKILREDHVIENGRVTKESHGGMAGIPISPFFANLYLTELDQWFEKRAILYYRYSDDILLFADTKEELEKHRSFMENYMKSQGLNMNPDKVEIYKPGESWDFLGFSYEDGNIGLSRNTVRKMKAKIKRKAEALRRWQRKKGIAEEERAAKGFIRSMNKKFFGAKEEDEFTWSRWFFPVLTKDDDLKELDAYMQQYIRYIITGRHYKGNYRITYQQLKEWGYRSLVNEYYRCKKGGHYDKKSIGQRDY